MNLGTRPGKTELFALRWSDVDFEHGEILIYRKKTDSHGPSPVSDAFLEKLRKKHREAESDYIVEYKGKPVKQLASSWRTAKRKAGITYKLPLYDIRHLFASQLFHEGANIVAISKLMGHSDVNTTLRHYAHLIDGGKRDAISRLQKALERKPKKEGKVVRLVS